MGKYSLFALFVMFVATAAESFGACHAVGPSATGNGSGSDWNNRMNKLPSTLVRGDTYYLMDGSYGSYNFSTPNSGTTRVTVKKAQSHDFGRTSDGCSNDISAGWNAAAMGSGQAGFTSITSNGGVGYFTVDGNGTDTSKPGCGVSATTNQPASDCGIKVTDALGSDGAFNNIGAYNNFNSPTTGVTIRFTEVQGGGDANNGNQEEVIWCRDGCSQLLMEHNYWHESGCDFVKLPFSTGAMFRYNVFKQNDSTAACHGQFYLSEATTKNVTFANNVIQDIQGTAIWSFVTGSQADSYNIYNNVLWRTQGSSRPGTSNGIFACINSGSKCTNIKFIGNSIINYTADYPGALGIRDENGGGSYTWENNIFYNIPSDRIGFALGSGTTFTEDHNSWLNAGSPRNGSGDVTITSSAPNPFVNWPGSDFQLASQNAAWGAGATLSSPFNTDMAGNQRPGADGVWNRGAFEYVSSQVPAPPSDLTSTVR